MGWSPVKLLPSHQVRAAFLVLCALAVGLVRVMRTPAWTADDAYIIARYARHLALDGRFAFNLSDPPVEGVTGVLLTLVEAVGYRVGLEPEVVGKGVGVVAFVACAPLIWALGRELRCSALATGAVAFLFFGAAEQVAHVRSGLETSLFLAASWTVMLCFAQVLRAAAPSTRTLAIACTALATIRPEGLAIGLALCALACLRHRHAPTFLPKYVRPVALYCLAPLALMQAARVAYFGAWLPNTYYAKRLDHWSSTFLRGMVTLVDSYLLTTLVVCAAVLVLCWLRGNPGARMWRPRFSWVLASIGVVTVVLVIAYSRSDLVMNYALRFPFHAYPWVLAAIGMMLHGALAVAHKVSPCFLPVTLTLAILAGPMLRSSDRVDEHRTDITHYQATMDRARWGVVPILRQRLPSHALIACYPDAGIIPYTSELRTLDFGRLNDGYLARQAPSPPQVAAYFFQHAADALIVSRHSDGRWYDAGVEAIMADPRFADYKQAGEFMAPTGGGLVVYLRQEYAR